MILYDCRTAPSPRRARLFIAEKGLTVETVQVDLAKGEHLTDAFRAISPQCTVPVLKLDDGDVITENVAIARYLEEMFPAVPLLGRTPAEKAHVAEWNARIEFEGLAPIADTLRNSARGFQGRALVGPRGFEQIPALAERGRQRLADFFVTLDSRLAGRDFVVGDGLTMADITAVVAVDFAAWVKQVPGDDLVQLRRWHAAMKARPAYAA
jgi:glutathione S-transferase